MLLICYRLKKWSCLRARVHFYTIKTMLTH